MNLDFLSNPITCLTVASLSWQHYSTPVNYNDNVVDERLAHLSNEDILNFTKPIEFDRSIPLENKIKSFCNLLNNWDGYGAAVPKKEVINNSLGFIKSLPDSLLTEVDIESIIPTPYGSIVIDFDKNNNIISVEIGENKIGFFTDFPSSENLSSDGIPFNQEIIPPELTKAFQKFYQGNI